MGRLRAWGRRGIAELTTILMLPVIGVAAGQWLNGKQAEYALAQRVEEYRRAGEPMMPADLEAPAVPTEENAVFDLLGAAGAVDWGDLDRSLFRGILLERPLTGEEMGEVRQLVIANQKALDRLKATDSRKKFGWAIDLSSPGEAIRGTDASAQSSLSALLVLAAAYSHQTGDHSEAVERLLQMLYVSRGMREQPLLLGYLMSLSMAEHAAQLSGCMAPDLLITRDEVAAKKSASRAKVKSLIATLLDDGQEREALRRALRSERVVLLRGAMGIADGTLTFRSRKPEESERLDVAMRAFVVKPSVLRNAVFVIQYLEEVKTAGDAPDWPSCEKRMPKWPARANTAIWDDLARPSVGFAEHAALERYRALALRRLGATALGVRLYAVEHAGRMPGKLADLVPDYLPGVPVDPFSGAGEPLTYEPQANPPVVRSVGEVRDGDEKGHWPAKTYTFELNSRLKRK